MSRNYFGRFIVKREPGKGLFWLLLGILCEVCWVVPIIGWVIGLVGGTFFIFFGLQRKRRGLFERFLQYAAVIGNREKVPVAELAQDRGDDANATREEISRILSKGYFGEGAYIDLREDCLVVPLPEQNMFADKGEIRKVQGETAENDVKEENSGYAGELDRVLGELDTVSGQIRDQGVKCRANRIRQLTEGIFQAIIDKPEREADVRKFMNYYLPSTIKLLKSYELLEDQSVQGENITASREKIESVLNQLVGAYEKQLDRLFSDDALDIATEVDVLQTMMSGDGLSEKKGITLTL